MSSGRRFAIPASFPEVFKGFAREALRSLPTDVPEAEVEQWLYDFGASYFGPGACGAQRLEGLLCVLTTGHLRWWGAW